jgi:hypothetical protein
VTAKVVSSPSGDGNNAVEVQVSSQVTLLLSKALAVRTSSNLSNFTVTATSFAEIAGGSPPCIVALSGGGTGVTLSGSGSITADACAVESENTLSVPCGTTLTTPTVDYGGSAPSVGCGGIVAPTGETLSEKHTTVSDPLTGNTEVSALRSRLTSGAIGSGSTQDSTTGVENMTQPSAPTVAGSCVPTFGSGWSGSGCPTSTCTWNSGATTLTCTGTGPFNFQSISFQTGGTNSIVDSTSGATFNIAQGISASGGTTITLPSGTYNLGAAKCSDKKYSATNVSICDSTTKITFAGPITMTASGGVYVGGGVTLDLGSSSTNNSFNLGKASDGNAVNVGGGSVLTFGDATGTGDVFETVGSINSSGGSCLALSAATNHDINGYITSSGGLMLGAGTYTISNYFSLGDPNNGGAVTCTVPWGVGSKTVGLYAVDVSIVLGGVTTLSDGTCGTVTFCIVAGFTNVTLEAPTSGSAEDMGVIGPASGSAGALFGQGASGGTITGAFYFPTEGITMNGGASTGSGTGSCLEMIGSQVTVSNGASTATYCTGLAGGQIGSNSSIVLVQ